jgi:putative ATP-dependent endonuclease of the OLD family
MRIARLSIKNFRSIEDADLELPQMCALVGPNNAGKTNLLLAVSRVLGRNWVNAQTFDDDLDRFRRDPDKDVMIAVSFDKPLEYRRFKAAPVAKIHSLEFTLTRYKQGNQVGQPRV